MLAEKMLSNVVRVLGDKYFKINPTEATHLPGPLPDKPYMLYMHVPFCEVLCPYCSFNRFSFSEELARPYFASMHREMDGQQVAPWFLIWR